MAPDQGERSRSDSSVGPGKVASDALSGLGGLRLCAPRRQLGRSSLPERLRQHFHVFAFGPLVITDLPITLFSVLTLWTSPKSGKTPPEKTSPCFLCVSQARCFPSSPPAFYFLLLSLLRSAPAGAPSRLSPLPNPKSVVWRRARWRATLKGILGAALVVYLFYFIFSIHQSTEALNRLGHGAATEPFRRLLMPAWLYLRGMLLVLVTGSRPTFILVTRTLMECGFTFRRVPAEIPSGIPRIVSVGGRAGACAKEKRQEHPDAQIIPNNLAIHWRVLWVSLIVFTGFCLLSRLDISIRHFCIPIALLILLLATLPRQIESLRFFNLTAARIAAITVVILVLACLFTAVRIYPYYFPYVNALSFGHPAYELVNDSNIDWNQSLPEARRFAERHGIQKINLDQYGFTDPTVTVPQAEVWNCQQPAAADSGKMGGTIRQHDSGWPQLRLAVAVSARTARPRQHVRLSSPRTHTGSR